MEQKVNENNSVTLESTPGINNNKNKFLTVELIAFFILLLALIFLGYKYFKLKHSIAQIENQILPSSSPENINQNENNFRMIQIENEASFFGTVSQFNDRAINYLVDNKYLDSQKDAVTNCTKEYSSNYNGFEEKLLYVDISQLKVGKNLVIPSQAELKDKILLSFIDSQNKVLQQANTKDRIGEISKCSTPNGKTIISYSLKRSNGPNSDVSENTALWTGLLNNNNSLDNLSVIYRVWPDGMFNCITAPFAYTKNDIGYFRCHSEGMESIYQLNLNNNNSKEILQCVARFPEPGIDSDSIPTTYSCKTPNE